jgi:hypothetical protein
MRVAGESVRAHSSRLMELKYLFSYVFCAASAFCWQPSQYIILFASYIYKLNAAALSVFNLKWQACEIPFALCTQWRTPTGKQIKNMYILMCGSWGIVSGPV